MRQTRRHLAPKTEEDLFVITCLGILALLILLCETPHLLYVEELKYVCHEYTGKSNYFLLVLLLTLLFRLI